MTRRAICLLFLSASLLGEIALAQSPPASEIAALLEEGDRLYRTRDEGDHAERAVAAYQKVLEIDPQNDAALWRLSRSLRWRGDIAASSETKLSAYKESEGWAKKAIDADPGSINGHLMLGIAYGRIGETQGVMKSLSLISPIKAEMKEVLDRDPDNDTAHHVLGVLYRKVPRLFGGSMKKSIEALQTAVRLNPAGASHYLELSRSYLENGDKEKARTELRSLLEISNPSDPVQFKLDRAEAEKMLAERNSR